MQYKYVGSAEKDFLVNIQTTELDYMVVYVIANPIIHQIQNIHHIQSGNK